MTRPSKFVSMAVSALLCAVLWPMPIFAQQSAGARGTTPAPPRATRGTPQGFSVVLVVGDLQGGGGEDDVPPAARRALADMKDFLPYKSYKLVDAAWIVGTTHTVSRLRGPEDRDYELEITTTEPRMARMNGQSPSAASFSEARIAVMFSLRDAGSGSGGGTGSGNGSGSGSGSGSGAGSGSTYAFLQQQLQDLQAQYREARNKYSSTHPEVVKLEAQIQALEQKTVDAERQLERRASASAQGRSSRPVINTSFSMDVGETVVVGTSRLSGNSKALIALLTAVPQKSSPR